MPQEAAKVFSGLKREGVGMLLYPKSFLALFFVGLFCFLSMTEQGVAGNDAKLGKIDFPWEKYFEYPIQSIDLSKNGRFVAFGDLAGNFRVVNLFKDESILTVPFLEYNDRRDISMLSEEGKKEYKKDFGFEPGIAGVSKVKFFPAAGKNRILVQYQTGHAQVYNVRKGRPVATLNVATTGGISVSPKQPFLGYAELGKGKVVVSQVNGKLKSKWSFEPEQLREEGSLVTSIDFSVNGKLLAVGFGNGAIEVWDYRSGNIKTSLSGYAKRKPKLPGRLKGKMSGIKTLTFSSWRRHKGMLFAGFEGGKIRAWEVPGGNLIGELDFKESPVAMDSHSKGLLVVAGQQKVSFWRISTMERVASRELSDEWLIEALRFSQDGNFYAFSGRYKGDKGPGSTPSKDMPRGFLKVQRTPVP